MRVCGTSQDCPETGAGAVKGKTVQLRIDTSAQREILKGLTGITSVYGLICLMIINASLSNRCSRMAITVIRLYKWLI